VERRRRVWNKNIIRMDAERLVKIPRKSGRKYPGRPKRIWSDLIPD
jgi:hypothetical protein